MNMKSFLRVRNVVAVGVIALVGAGFVACGSKGDALPYRTEKIDQGTIAQTVSANGTLNPVTLVSVGTQVSGTITELYVDFNDQVKAGQVLMKLDDALLRAALQQSEANLRKLALRRIDCYASNRGAARHTARQLRGELARYAVIK